MVAVITSSLHQSEGQSGIRLSSRIVSGSTRPYLMNFEIVDITIVQIYSS